MSVLAKPTRRHARRVLRRAVLRSEKKGWGPEEKRTAVLGVVAVVSVAAFVTAEVGRVWRRGSAPMPGEADHLLAAAEEAVAETVEAARVGYRQAPVLENATFMLLTSFVTIFISARGISYLLRRRSSVGPFRDLRVGKRHIHHFVPGIALLMLSGGAAILTRNEDLEPKLAVVFGAGMGMTLDESALLLELEDVYWTEEGLLGVQITLAVAALFAALALGLKFLRRGEELVLEGGSSGPGDSLAGDPASAARA
ncbi:MAG: hypothetical protein QOC77_2327 [Thermoleophilaceae bacterium]|jgi:hypothetical protein|nr:hypothetical protein [Thermoleophilaceae bacterium]MEA2472025.1 hypothetical protein [Thermoleophilaceae bacterium]